MDEKQGGQLIPVGNGTAVVAVREGNLPAMVSRAGAAAVFATEEFFHGKIRNPNTRVAYERAVRKFLEWCDGRGLELHTVRPKDVGEYMDGLGSLSKKQQHLSALRHFFDVLVLRHAVILNPAHSVRGEHEDVVEGKTPEIPVRDARRLLGHATPKGENCTLSAALRPGSVDNDVPLFVTIFMCAN